MDGSCYGRLLLCGGLLLWKTPVVEDSGNILLRSVAGAHVRLLSLLYPRFFSVLGILTSFCFSVPKDFSFSGYSYFILLLYTQRLSLLWVLLMLLLLYTQRFFFLWVLLMLLLLYTQRFFFLWVFLLHFASLYPKIFLSLGTLNAFASLYPKVISSMGIYLTFVSDIPKLLYSSEYNKCFSFHRTSFMSSITQPSFSI